MCFKNKIELENLAGVWWDDITTYLKTENQNNVYNINANVLCWAWWSLLIVHI